MEHRRRAAPAQRRGTRQNFTITVDATEETGTVVASGAINATGEDVVIGATADHFVFPDGTLTVFHAPMHYTEQFNAKRCTLTFHETGNYVISSGPGAYEWPAGTRHAVGGAYVRRSRSGYRNAPERGARTTVIHAGSAPSESS